MDRRDFVATGSGIGFAGLAGCTGVLDGGAEDDESNDEDAPTDDEPNGDDVPPDASIAVADQRTLGMTFTIDGLETDAETSLTVLDEDGDEIAGTGIAFEGGAAVTGRVVEFYDPLVETEEITVQLVHAEHGVVAEASAELEVVEEVPADLERGEVTAIEADPELGFEYPYVVYVPSELEGGDGRLLVEPNNTGTPTDTFPEHRAAAERIAENGFGRRLSDELVVPLLVPVFPRPRNDPVDWTHYVHALDAETMAIEEGTLARVDRQLLRMVDHARSQLLGLSYDADERILMNGFSASGNFVNRFAALHPDRVRAVTAGGINGTAILPRTQAEGHELPYPIGVADAESLTGESFDEDAWTDVAQFVYMGGEDDNDTIPYDDAWSDELREIALDVYGEDMQDDRMPYCESVYDEAGASAQFYVYPEAGHTVSGEMVDDLVAFLERNADRDAGLEPIEPSTPLAALVELSLAEPPRDGDTDVTVDVFIDDEASLDDESVTVMVSPGTTIDYQDRYEDLGDRDRSFYESTDETRTVALDDSADGVPLESGEKITIALVLGSELATVTTTVE